MPPRFCKAILLPLPHPAQGHENLGAHRLHQRHELSRRSPAGTTRKAPTVASVRTSEPRSVTSLSRGFGVRVSYGGKKASVVRYRVNDRLRRLTLGPYPDLSLAEARRKARMIMGDVAHGDDPAQDKQARRDAETFKGLAKAYLEVAEKRHRSWKEEKRIIDKDLLPEFGPRLLVDVRRRDVRELVEAIARKRNAPVMANRTLGVLSRMFNFALDREWIEASPATRIPEPGEERSRDRVLGDDELRELWVSLESLGNTVEPADDDEDAQDDGAKKAHITPATAQAFQVQLLTAQRPGEVRSMKWADVDLESGWWSIPGAVAKNGQPHRVPLTKKVVDILKARLKRPVTVRSSCSRTVVAPDRWSTAARKPLRCCASR